MKASSNELPHRAGPANINSVDTNDLHQGTSALSTLIFGYDGLPVRRKKSTSTDWKSVVQTQLNPNFKG